MLSKKIFLSAALVSMAGLVACGDDSSSSAGDATLPEKVKTIQEANDLKCDASVKCAKVFVEEEIVNDYFQCDGERWQPATDPKFNDLCPAEEKKAEGEEKGEGEGEKTPESSASEAGSTDSGAESTDSGANSTDSSAESADSNENSSDSNTTSTDSNASSTDSNASSANSGSGEMVSCNIPSDVPGMDTCMEFPAGSDEATAVQAQCESVYLGTLGTGCAK